MHTKRKSECVCVGGRGSEGEVKAVVGGERERERYEKTIRRETGEQTRG